MTAARQLALDLVADGEILKARRVGSLADEAMFHFDSAGHADAGAAQIDAAQVDSD